VELIEQRAKTHGDFALTAERAARLQDMTRVRIDEPPVMRHGREMICVKQARIASGDPYCVDHWEDIAGYASLVAEWLKRRAGKPPLADLSKMTAAEVIEQMRREREDDGA
jgi:hypothetical protein